MKWDVLFCNLHEMLSLLADGRGEQFVEPSHCMSMYQLHVRRFTLDGTTQTLAYQPPLDVAEVRKVRWYTYWRGSQWGVMTVR